MIESHPEKDATWEFCFCKKIKRYHQLNHTQWQKKSQAM
jgi:hypothetical protein